MVAEALGQTFCTQAQMLQTTLVSYKRRVVTEGQGIADLLMSWVGCADAVSKAPLGQMLQRE